MKKCQRALILFPSPPIPPHEFKLYTFSDGLNAHKSYFPHSLTLYLHSQIFRLEPFFASPPTPFFAVISTENIFKRALKKSALDVIKKPKQKVSFFLVFMRLSGRKTLQ